jgi:hypothetical protein
LINDGIAFALLGVAVHEESLGTAVASGILYQFGPMFVHFGNHRYGVGAGSFGIRAGLPLLTTLFVVSATGCPRSDPCWDRNLGTGILIGWIGATAIDAGLLAWKPDKNAHVLDLNVASRLRLTPAVNFGNHTLGVDLQAGW